MFSCCNLSSKYNELQPYGDVAGPGVSVVVHLRRRWRNRAVPICRNVSFPFE